MYKKLKKQKKLKIQRNDPRYTEAEKELMQIPVQKQKRKILKSPCK